MKRIKLFESFTSEDPDFISPLLDSATCEIIITGCTPWDSNVGHWYTHEHLIRIKFIGSSLENPGFDENKEILAFGEIMKGNFEILVDESQFRDIHSAEDVFDRDNIMKIASEYDGKDESDLDDFASDLHRELYDVVLDWFREQEKKDEDEDEDEEDKIEKDGYQNDGNYDWMTPDNTDAISEVMEPPKIVWY